MPPIFMPGIQRTLLFLPPPFCFPLRDCHPVSCNIPEDFMSTKKVLWASHLRYCFQQPIQLALCGFGSLLLTASQLVSFPAGTKTFQFPAFPTLSSLKRSRIRIFLVQRLHAPRQNISPLDASFIG